MYRAIITAGSNDGAIIESESFKAVYHHVRRFVRENTKSHAIAYSSANIFQVDSITKQSQKIAWLSNLNNTPLYMRNDFTSCKL